LKNFGSVNPNATAEYQILRDRYNFLESQKDDLSESKKKLELLIRKLIKKLKRCSL